MIKIESFYYSSSFKKSVRKYWRLQKKIEKKIDTFIKNPFHSSLQTHKLTENLKNYWSFSIEFHTRILFEFIDNETVGLIDIGTHEIVFALTI